jgi:hypothetical protein
VKKSHNGYMSYAEIGEKIKMLAIFNGGTIFPYAFDWGKRRYKIDKVNLAYQERDGSSINYFFAIEAAELVGKIKYNNLSFVWTLLEIWQE